MSQDFLYAVVSACPYARASAQLPYIMCCSYSLRAVPRALAKTCGLVLKIKDRSLCRLECILSSKFGLVDLLPLKIAGAQPNTVHKFIGLAFGFPIAVRVARQAKATVGAYMHVGICWS